MPFARLNHKASAELMLELKHALTILCSDEEVIARGS